MVLRKECNNYEWKKETREDMEKAGGKLGIRNHCCFQLIKTNPKTGERNCPINNEDICFNKICNQTNIDEAPSKAVYDF